MSKNSKTQKPKQIKNVVYGARARALEKTEKGVTVVKKICPFFHNPNKTCALIGEGCERIGAADFLNCYIFELSGLFEKAKP
jgi:hypothetical protein